MCDFLAVDRCLDDCIGFGPVAGKDFYGGSRHENTVCGLIPVQTQIAARQTYQQLAIGPAGEIIRLAEEEGERLTPQVRDSIRDKFSKTVRDDGSVWAASSSWFVTAYNPE